MTEATTEVLEPTESDGTRWYFPVRSKREGSENAGNLLVGDK
jgi:hypothetical protein